MFNLVYNEMLKMIRKRRILVVTLILIVLIPIFTYAQYKSIQNTVDNIGTSDWKTVLQQQIVDQQNRLASSRVPEEFKQLIKFNIQQQQYYLDHNINPTEPGAPTFIREFIQQSTSLFLPLLVIILAADIVSSEQANGTIKLLLTRPVARWKILLSKYISLILSTSLMLTIMMGLSYLISGLIFGYRGWTLPVISGFQTRGEQLITDQVHILPQWQYILMAGGLAWFVCIVVGTLAFMVSVLMKNTASSMGVMLAALISGSLLEQVAHTWSALKYSAFTHLRLTDYLSGNLSLVEGMTLPFSLMVLSTWALIALVISFVTFSRRDILA